MSAAEKLDGIRQEMSEATEYIARLAEAARAAESGAPIELAGVQEAAAITGLSPNSIGTYRQRGLLPKPIAELGCGSIWRRLDLEQWAASRAK